MPIHKKSNNSILCVGNYCSLECAAAHNYDREHSSHTAHLRHHLINELACSGSTGVNKSVRPSPRRELLTLLGGCLSIEEFRDLSEAHFIVYPYPIIVHPLSLEDIHVHTDSHSGTSRFVPIDDSSINAFTSGLRRPKKHKNHKHTLDFMLYMDETADGEELPSDVVKNVDKISV